MLNIYLKNNSLWTIETYTLVWSGKGNCKKWTFIVVKKFFPQVHLFPLSCGLFSLEEQEVKPGPLGKCVVGKMCKK